MSDNPLNGTGPLVEERAPVPAWLLAADVALEQELAIRSARIAGLDHRAARDEDDPC